MTTEENKEEIPKKNFAIQHSPFLYHSRLKTYFQERKKTWEWFAAQDNKVQQVEALKTNLLKNTYRLDVNSHKKLYDITAEVCTKLNLNASVTLYQEHNSIQLNAGISVIENEAHIVFSGGVISLLSDKEMKALLAHELSHYLFYKVENEEYEVTQRIVLAMANHQESENVMIETARVFQLYLELFCDQGALKVCGDYKPVVQMLVKMNTNLKEVNAESYLAQAKEIVLSDNQASKKETHPESYLRSLALFYAQEDPKTFLEKIETLIEGELDLNALDIFQQKELLSHTIDLIHLIIKPSWMKTGKILNLSQQYFEHHFSEENKSVEDLYIILEKTSLSIKKYICYILLDFAKVDSDMEGIALGHAFELAELLNLKSEFEKIVRKEFKLNARSFKSLQEKVINEVSQMKESRDESLYNN